VLDDTFEGVKLGTKHYLGGEINFEHNGRTYGGSMLANGMLCSHPYQRTVKGYAGWVWGKVMLDDESNKAMLKAVEEIIDEVTSDDVKAEKTEADKKAHAERIEAAKETIVAAEKQTDIPTHDEKHRRLVAWNNLYNEGGDGYLPDIIDIDQYEHAKRLLAEEGLSE
jgi:hypothetical protein